MATVDEELGSVDEAGVVTGKAGDPGGHLLGLGETAVTTVRTGDVR
ncbi:hypothetical protein ACFXKR_41430 [Streptomyces violascens]